MGCTLKAEREAQVYLHGGAGIRDDADAILSLTQLMQLYCKRRGLWAVICPCRRLLHVLDDMETACPRASQ